MRYPSALRTLLGPAPSDGVRPDFVIVGAAKAGTTSLFHWLRQHPQVATGPLKEIHYFDNQYAKGLDWYRSNFPSRARMREVAAAAGRAVSGEASPYYMFHPHAIRRLHADVPEAKLIVLLREPVARARSHYQHNVRKGEETLSFEDAIVCEGLRTAGEAERMMRDEFYYSVPFRRYTYAARGVYAPQLETIYAHFDRRQVLVVNSDDLFSDPLATFRTVCEYLGVDGFEPSDMEPRNTGQYEGESAVRRTLREQMAPHNEALYRLVGRDFGWPTE